MHVAELFRSGVLFAADAALDGPATPFLPDTFWPGVVLTTVFGLLGIFMVVVGFKVFDLMTPRIDIQRELAENKNLAVAIVTAAVILGICYVVAHAIVG